MADNDDTCRICLEGVNWDLGEKEGIVLKCNHAFHIECIFQYAIDIHQCPNCRCDLRTKSTPRQSFSYTRVLPQERHTPIYNQPGDLRLLNIFNGCLIFAGLLVCFYAIVTAPINNVNIVSSPSSIIITNTTIHVCSSPTNCTTFTTFENAIQHAWAILSQAPVFSWHKKVATHGKEFVNLLDECRV